MKEHTAAYSDRFDAAVALAVNDFRSTVRKGTSVAYVTHLFAVTCLVGEYGGDEDQLIAAMLHDWLEDIEGADPEVLEARFGPRVRRLVEGLSDSVEHPKPPWRPRKEAYLAHLRGAPSDLKLISAADKLHNAQCIRRDFATVGTTVWSRFTAGREGTLWYYQQVAEALKNDWPHPLALRLSQEVTALQADAACNSR